MFAEEQQRLKMQQAAKVKAAQMQAQALGIDPVLAAGDPDTVAALYRQKMTPPTPRQIGFEERLYNSLGDEEKKQYIQSKMGGGKLSYDAQVAQREQQADRLGMDRSDPRRQGFILTGEMPQERSQSLTTVDKKAIFDAEDKVPVLDNTITSLKSARDLNRETYHGRGAGIQGSIGSTLPDALVPDFIAEPEKAKKTAEFGKIMNLEAIKNMASTLKGATTDSELARFVDILSDPSTPPDIRERTIDRMIQLAEREKAVSGSRINDLRGGTYYRPGGGGTGFNGAPSSGFSGPVQVDGYTIRRK
jgi:hypothetical protein